MTDLRRPTYGHRPPGIGATRVGTGTPIFIGDPPALRRVETRTFDDSDNILVRYIPLDAAN